ncbi:MAG TPA: hemerythrin family protein [Methylophilaceae bacterium]|jgi:hemerythrin
MKPLYIVWNDDSNLGVPIIDEQHHAIVATINSLYFFIQEGWGLSALKPTLNIIKMYSGFHAKTEEGILMNLQYPELPEHIQCQKRFEKYVDEATSEALLNQDPNILLKFLRDWWIGHLKTEHAEYAEVFKKLK